MRLARVGVSVLWRGIKWAFLALTIGSACVALLLVLQAGNAKQLHIESPDGAKSQQARVDAPLIIERKAGKMIWRLKAQKAEQELKGSMHLLDPELELFSEDGKRIPITGREAWFNPLSKAIHFKGDVVAHYDEWVLYSEDVSYDHAADTVLIPGDFRIEGKLTKARGRGMTVWRVDHHVRIEEAAWIEDRHPNQMGLKP